MPNRWAKRFFFSLAGRERLRIPHLGGADLLTHDDEFPHQFPETVVFRDLRFGTFDSGALRNDLGDRLSSNSMSQGKGRAVSRGVLLSTVAVGLAAPTEARGQKTGAQVLDVGQTGDELIPFISECLQGNGHRSLLSDRHYKLSGIINCQIRKENPNQTLSDSAGDFYVVRPHAMRYLLSYRGNPNLLGYE
jgi:hypothetical protein